MNITVQCLQLQACSKSNPGLSHSAIQHRSGCCKTPATNLLAHCLLVYCLDIKGPHCANAEQCHSGTNRQPQTCGHTAYAKPRAVHYACLPPQICDPKLPQRSRPRPGHAELRSDVSQTLVTSQTLYPEPCYANGPQGGQRPKVTHEGTWRAGKQMHTPIWGSAFQGPNRTPPTRVGSAGEGRSRL